MMKRWHGAACLLLMLGLAAAGCARHNLFSFSLDTPPLILVPVSLAGVTDMRGRFREIYCTIQADHGHTLADDRPCDRALVRLADEPRGTGMPLETSQRTVRVVIVPGIFGECVMRFASPFSDGLAHLREHGYDTEVIHVSGLSDSAHNARQIRDAMMSETFRADKRVLLIGYSKGAPDALEALLRYPELWPRVAALVSVAGVIAGSPLADSVPDIYARLIGELKLSACQSGDGGGIESLRRSTRLTALARRPLPIAVRYFSVGGIVTAEETSRLLRRGHRALDAIDPRNDGQLIFTDSIIPGGALLGFVRADHWAIALPFSRSTPALARVLVEHNAFPREILLEAIVRTVEEAL